MNQLLGTVKEGKINKSDLDGDVLAWLSDFEQDNA